MSLAVVLAGGAGACGIAAAWEGLAALEQAAVVGATARVLRSLRAVGRSGREPTQPERRRLGLVACATLFAGGWLIAGPVVAAAVATAGPWAALRLVAARRRRWQIAMVTGAPATARALADALAGGHSIRAAIGEAARDRGLAAVTAAELQVCVAALALGARTDDVLERLRVRVAHAAYDTIVAAILLQRDAGGDLAGLLRALASDLQESGRVEAEARAATAQARFTAVVVALLPAGAAALAALADPGLLAALAAKPPALALAAGAVALQAVGFVVIGRLSRPAA